MFNSSIPFIVVKLHFLVLISFVDFLIYITSELLIFR